MCVSETNVMKASFIKEKKIEKKEIYNVQKILSNCRDTLANSKAEISKLELRDSKLVAFCYLRRRSKFKTFLLTLV